VAEFTDQAFQKALSITKSFEGADYDTVTGNFDGMILSVGILQWNIGSQTLQRLLVNSFQADKQKFYNIFGRDTADKIIKACLSKDKLFFENVYKDKKLRAAFAEWGRQFASIQDKEARLLARHAARTCETYELNTERGFCWAYDLTVQNGSMGQAGVEAKEYIRTVAKPLGLSEIEVLKALTSIRARFVRQKYVADFTARKLTIAVGIGRVHGKNYSLNGLFTPEVTWRKQVLN